MTSNQFAPDVVYGLGGGGKDMALSLLEEEWFLEELLAPRAHSPEDLTVRLLDTATGAQNEDQRRIEEIRQHRNEIQEANRGGGSGRPGDLTIEYETVTDGVSMMNATSLTGAGEVPAIAEANGVSPEDWWLKPGDVDENLNFAKGVFRRRGLAKGTLYKALAERGEVERQLETTEPGRVAIFVGLGGGSGAGMLFDVIERVKESNRTNEITVFGVLPAAQEDDDDVHANAYVALCELERLRLSEDDPLENVVLYHLDPTGYQGKNGNLVGTVDELEEFDSVFAQSVLAYYGAEGEDPFNRTPSFAPFTVAVPGMLRYNVDAYETAREQMAARVDALAEAVDAENALLSRVESFLDGVDVPREVTGTLTDADCEHLRGRLETLAELADEELFAEMEYTAREAFLDAFEAAHDSVGDEHDVVAIVDALEHRCHALSNADARAVDDLDSRLSTVLHDGVRNLSVRARLLQRRRHLEETPARQVGELLRADESQQSKLENSVAPDLRATHDRAVDALSAAKTEVETIQSDLADHRAERDDRVEDAVRAWSQETTGKRKALRRYDPEAAATRVQELERSLREFAERIEDVDQAETATTVDASAVTDALEALADFDAASQATPNDQFTLVNREWIETNLARLRKAREAALKADSSSFLAKIPGLGNESPDDAEARFTRLQGELSRGGVFSVSRPGNGFSVTVSFDADERLTALEEYLSSLERAVIDQARTVAPDECRALDDSETRRLLTDVRAGADAEATLADLLTDAFAAPADLESAHEAAIDELATVEAREAVLAAAVDCFDDVLSGPYKQYLTHRTAAADARAAYRSVGDDLAGDDGFEFEKTLQPSNIVAAAGQDGIAAAELLADDAEFQQFEQGIQNLLDNVCEATYHGLAARRVEGRRTNYHGMDVNVGLVTPTLDRVRSLTGEMQRRLGTAFGVGAPGTSNDKVGVYKVDDEEGKPVGDPWAFGMTAFISGVFLDNLRVVGDQRYQQAYTDRLGSETAHLHHALALEDGELVRRAEHLSIADPEVRDFYAGEDEAVIVERILNELSVREPVPSVRGGSVDESDWEWSEQAASDD